MAKSRTYVTLFSSAGIGDFGFYKAGFQLVASNELIERRLNIQRANNIAKYNSAYILGDITQNETKNKIYDEINRWTEDGHLDQLDLLVATPPCQGISVANHFKKNDEINRNSLVLESIIISEKIKPKIIVFENVLRFLKTACTDVDGKTYEIQHVIHNHLSKDYKIFEKEVNFKNYGANSSRPRTLVLMLRKDEFPLSEPEELMPEYRSEITLRQVIGDMKSLTEMGEVDDVDLLHQFRSYRPDMREWIHGLEEGQSAFENKNPNEYPHRTIDGKYVPNANKNGDKYRRQFWDRVAPAIHTRNDILASQNTVHPKDDRVFSIRELMKLMNIPEEFKWDDLSLSELNNLTDSEKKLWLKKNEMNIRQSIGEAVPTSIFEQIGNKAITLLDLAERTEA